jgi:DNA polymerase III subunit gamma/tau
VPKALYRKYRSKSLSEVVGQSHVTDILARSLEQGIIAHAYLLTGPRGTGKTSIARILAHEINKLPYDEETPHLDIIEIDAASNNGVEDVRELREKVQIAPVSAAKKIYIIDEVHMLSKAAFNALLKTLEEPPEHAVFILATTDTDKLPATIISRTQRFNFRAMSINDGVKHLRYIADQEKIKITDDALELIATRGDGSFRDSVSLLDQLRSTADKKAGITRELVEQSLGLAPTELVNQLLDAYDAKDLQTIVKLLDDSERDGVQSTVLTSQLIQAVHIKLADKPTLIPLLDQLIEVARSPRPNIKLLTILATHATPKPKTAALSAPAAEVSAPIAELEKQATKETPSIQKSNRSATIIKDNLQSHSVVIIDKHLQPELDAASGPDGKPGAKPFVRDDDRDDSQDGKDTPNRSQSAQTSHSTPTLRSRPTRDKSLNESSSAPLDNNMAAAIANFDWSKLIDYTRQNYVAVYSVLAKCSYKFDDSTLVIYTGNKFYKKKLDDSKHRINLQKSLEEIGAGDLLIETIGTPPPPKDSQAAAVAAIMGGGEEVSVGE